MSLNGSLDEDWFKLSLAAGERVSVSLLPVGRRYLEGPGTFGCGGESFFDSTKQRNLGLRVETSSGSPLMTQDAFWAGQGETADFTADTAGMYYFNVFGDGADRTQLYSLQVARQAPGGDGGEPPTSALSRLDFETGDLSEASSIRGPSGQTSSGGESAQAIMVPHP